MNESQPSLCSATVRRNMSRFFFANYLLMLLQLVAFACVLPEPGLYTIFFDTAVILSYSILYLIPAWLILAAVKLVLRVLRIRHGLPAWYTAAVIVLTLSQLLLAADRTIYRMYGFHFNGFVWNILTTRGGFESMGFSGGAYGTVAALIAGGIAIEAAVLVFCCRWKGFSRPYASAISRWVAVLPPYAAAVMFAVQALFFGISSYNAYSPVLIAANSYPFYVPITFQGALNRLGFHSERKMLTARSAQALSYPLAEIRRLPEAPHYNIVWLVAESWRQGMLTEEIMPRTYAFSKSALRFQNHFSGGNGTRQAMFAMFYGLYGSYWQAFLNEQRPPVLMQLLGQDGYQFQLYTSARFTYPEFDKTLFSGIPQAELHECANGQSWQRDRQNVSDMLDAIDARDPDKPFLSFLFFESPHAPYDFPPECAVRKDYLKKFNYASDDIQQDIDQIFNRYVNACNHLDSQFARVIDFLEQKDLMETTIVIITGDHGEEFMEHGRWGHNSDFNDEQTRVPLVMRVPQMAPAEYAKMTSHLDIAPTLMHLLGVENPDADFSFGIDLLSDTERSCTVFSDWDSLVYRDKDCRIRLPMTVSSSLHAANEVFLSNDTKAANASALLQQKMASLVCVLHDCSGFTAAHKDQKWGPGNR
ncbi:MAG: sulfatase-like hydrolase/transferase [Planctomycetaceae bacterium]|nr:sulfatase-like hydrolase/transferase [Planctomycetaceae bacterium]